MVIEQQITAAIIAGIKELYGADIAAKQVQLQKTKKEFKGHLTLVVFPFLRMSRKSPEQTAQEIGEYLLKNESTIAEFNGLTRRICMVSSLHEVDKTRIGLGYTGQHTDRFTVSHKIYIGESFADGTQGGPTG